MSNAPKRPYEDVLAVALDVRDLLAPACEQIHIAGSLRREVRMISDIEIVAIPRTRQYLDLLGAKAGTVSELDELLDSMQLSFSKKGKRYQQFTYQDFQVDLFLGDINNIGYLLMLRTGPSDFSRAMVTPRPYGFKPSHLTVRDGYVWANHLVGGPQARTRESVPDEETLFKLWRMDFIDPKARK